MIAILTKDDCFRDYLESVLKEQGFAISSARDARLCLIDLDSGFAPIPDKACLTLSANVFVASDLVRPFLQRDLVSLCQMRLGWQPLVDNTPFERENEGEEFTLGEGCIYRYGEKIVLTPAEFRLFSLLYENRGKIVALSLCDAACRIRATKGNSVSVTLASLRKKLDYRFGKRYFVSHRKEGYQML